MPDRERRTPAFLGRLGEALDGDVDLIEFLHLLVECCLELPDVAAAGLLLADPRGRLEVLAASSDRVALHEVLALQNNTGPARDCYQLGIAVTASNLATAGNRWPGFAAPALEAGFASVNALPIRLDDITVGALNLFHPAPGAPG